MICMMPITDLIYMLRDGVDKLEPKKKAKKEAY